jgi:hypothetical protein
VLRRIGVAGRFRMVEELTAMTTHLSRQAIRIAMPFAGESEVILRWIEITYGMDIADRIRPHAHELGPRDRT